MFENLSERREQRQQLRIATVNLDSIALMFKPPGHRKKKNDKKRSKGCLISSLHLKIKYNSNKTSFFLFSYFFLPTQVLRSCLMTNERQMIHLNQIKRTGFNSMI